jgi:hypothetical protein
MNRIIFLALIGVVFCRCKEYENQNEYEVKIGETVEIYYTTNSCCYYCLSNEKDLKHVKLIERRKIDGGKKDCAGCNYTAAFVFKAVSIGIDTIELKLLGAAMDCDSNEVDSEEYIIRIK